MVESGRRVWGRRERGRRVRHLEENITLRTDSEKTGERKKEKLRNTKTYEDLTCRSQKIKLLLTSAFPRVVFAHSPLPFE